MKICTRILAIIGSLLFAHVNAHAALNVNVTAGTVEKLQVYDWLIEKNADAVVVPLDEDELWPVTYSIQVDAIVGPMTSHVHGTITITNSGFNSVEVSGMRAFIGAAEVYPTLSSCSFPASLASFGGSTTCVYDLFRDNGDDFTLTVVAEIAPDVTAGSGSIDIILGDVQRVDTCVEIIDVNDSSSPRNHCAVSGANLVYEYTKTIGPYTDPHCGAFTLSNTATIVGVDSQVVLALSTWDLTVIVNCEGDIEPVDCVRTQGYWSRHSVYGPAAEDLTWNRLLPRAADTPFFLSGMTYYEVFGVQWKISPLYGTLSQHYIGTKLNGLAGAPIPGDTQNYMIVATDYLSKNTPEEIAALKETDFATWQSLGDIAGYLESYNKGKEGTPKCK